MSSSSLEKDQGYLSAATSLRGSGEPLVAHRSCGSHQETVGAAGAVGASGAWCTCGEEDRSGVFGVLWTVLVEGLEELSWSGGSVWTCLPCMHCK